MSSWIGDRFSFLKTFSTSAGGLMEGGCARERHRVLLGPRRMARRLFQNSRAPEFQSSRAPELRSSKAPELQSFRVRYALFSQFFSRWWMRTSCLVVYRYHHVAAAVDLHEEGIFFRFCLYKDENLPRLGSHCIYHAGMLWKDCLFPDPTSEVYASDGQHRSSWTDLVVGHGTNTQAFGRARS